VQETNRLASRPASSDRWKQWASSYRRLRDKYLRRHLESPLNLVATALDLRHQGPHQLTEQQQGRVVDLLRRLVTTEQARVVAEAAAAEQPVDVEFSALGAMSALLTDDGAAPGGVRASDEAQLSMFVRLAAQKWPDDSRSAITRLATVPTIQRLARRVLCIPAGESAAERVFSHVKHIMPTTRCAMSTSTLCALTFLRCNKKL
jgi:hypothetical protein